MLGASDIEPRKIEGTGHNACTFRVANLGLVLAKLHVVSVHMVRP